MRDFSFIRHRPGFCDLLLTKQAGADAYSLEWDPNFDGVFTPFLSVSSLGHIDDSLIGFPRDLVNRVDNIRVVFDPKNYSIPENTTYWLRVTPSTGGVPGTPGMPGMIVPDVGGYKMLVIKGLAPSGASIANSLRLDFPRTVCDIRVVNLDTTNTLYVATEEGGAEYEASTSVDAYPMSNILGATPHLLVRGGGAAVLFTATFTFAFPR